MNHNINTAGNFSDDDQWVQTLYDQYQESIDNQAASFRSVASEPSRSTDVSHHVLLNPRGCVSKPSRPRRSRASRRTPATLLNANASNFRALVQQFTGCPARSISFAAHKGPVTLCFDRNITRETAANKNHDNHHHSQPRQYSHHNHHQLHQQELVPDHVVDQRQQVLLMDQQYNSNNYHDYHNGDHNLDHHDGRFSNHLMMISNDDFGWCGNPRASMDYS